MWIDSHTHFYDPSRPQGIPWPPVDSPLYRTVLPAEFETVAAPVGVTRTVVVEASPWLADNHWLLDLAAESPAIVGVVGHLDPTDPRFAHHLTDLAANPLLRGIRIGGHSLAGCDDALRIVAGADLTLDVLVQPADLPCVVTLAQRLPTLRIVVNHIGGLQPTGSAPPAGWQAAMTELAACPNVYCKVSSLPENAGRQPARLDAAYYRPITDWLWATFGGDRLMYGSNWPVCEPFADYARIFQLAQACATERGEREMAQFLAGSATQAYRLESQGVELTAVEVLWQPTAR